MTKFISLLTKSNNTNESIFTRLLVHFLSASQTNYKVALLYSFSIGIAVGILFFFLTITFNLTLSLFSINTAAFSEITVKAAFYSFLVFFSISYICVMIVILENISFKRITTNKFFEKTLSFSLSMLMFLIHCLIFAFILSLRPTLFPGGFPEYLNQSKIESHENKNFSVEVSHNESSEITRPAHYLSSDELSNMSPEDLEELIDSLKVRESLNAMAEMASEEMVKSFSDINLYPKSNIDWSGFLHDLDSMPSEKEPYVSFRISYALK